MHIAHWMAAHLHVPQMLAWVLRNGGHLHSGFRHQVERSLTDNKPEIPARLRLLWTVLLNSEPPNPWASSWTSDRYEAATSEAERRRIEDEVIESIAPRLLLRPGPAPALHFRVYAEKPPRPVEPIEACGHLRLVAGDRETRDQVKEILATPSFLTRHAETLTGYLEQALALAEDDDDSWRSPTRLSGSYRRLQLPSLPTSRTTVTRIGPFLLIWLAMATPRWQLLTALAGTTYFVVGCCPTNLYSRGLPFTRLLRIPSQTSILQRGSSSLVEGRVSGKGNCAAKCFAFSGWPDHGYLAACASKS